jgi:hypothetical protein
MNAMMQCGEMIWGMRIIGVLGLVALVLLIAALIKYLFFSERERKRMRRQ